MEKHCNEHEGWERSAASSAHAELARRGQEQAFEHRDLCKRQFGPGRVLNFFHAITDLWG